MKLVLLAALAVFLCASPGSAGETPLKMSQLNIEIGGKKSGKKKCSEHECLEQGKHKKKHSDKNDKHKNLKRGIGLGLGIVIDSVETSPKKKKKVQKSGSPTTVTSTKKKKDAKNSVVQKKKDAKNSVVRKKKDAKDGVVQKKNADDPKDKPVFVPLEFPALAIQDCEDCYELWESILWYETIIDADARKLFERRQQLEDRKAEVEELRSKLGGAGPIDKVYYSQEIDRHSEYIASMEQLNEELEQLIAREWTILRERIDQYAECAEHYCPVLTQTAQVESPPASSPPAPEPPPVNSAPPADPVVEAEPAASGTGFDLGDTLKLDLGYGGKNGGYSPGPTSYGPPIPASRPPEDDRKICGPDITPAVIKTLKKIREEFNNSPEKQTAACRSLIHPRTGGSAWDIGPLSPAVAVPQTGEKEPPFNYEKASDSWVQRDEKGNVKSWRQPWFTSTSHMCAIPRNDPVCAPTVEFFGICEHAQVVNYVQWRFMLGLCGGAYPYVGPLLHKAWNTIQYGGNAPKQAQDNMSEVAEKILDKLESDENTTDFSDIQEALVALDAGLSKEVRQCELKCPHKIDREFDYVWTGLTRDTPITPGRLDRDLKDMADEGVDKLKTKAAAAGVTADSLRPSPILDQILKSLGLN